MNVRTKRVLSWIVGISVIVTAAAAVVISLRHRKALVLRGAVTVKNSDTRKEVPVADVIVTVSDDIGAGTAKSDASGYFNITLPPRIRRGHSITLKFRHPEYLPLDERDFVGDQLYVSHLTPRPRAPMTAATGPETTVSNMKVRYSIKNFTIISVGSATTTFQVINTGNVPCQGKHPCSPDGKWKAAIASAALDAGVGNEYRNARVSCIAGPCPFTKIEMDGFSSGGQKITVSARNWSDTTTFLMEAEVFHPMVSQIIHESYPVVFGPTLNFTLPSDAEGICIEAELNRETIIFPLGPDLFLSWATCNARVNPDRTKVYSCELKPRFRFP